MKRIVLALLCASGCGPHKEKPRDDPPMDVSVKYASTAGRLETLDDGGWVVSRTPDGVMQHTGDSLIWTGLSLYALPCDALVSQVSALKTMIDQTGGQLYRHPTLKDQVSADGALGLYKGLASVRERCPDSWGWLSPSFALHHSQLATGYLNDVAKVKLPQEWAYIEQRLAWKVGIATEPSAVGLLNLEASMAAWAESVKATHGACWRVHLAWLALSTAEDLGAVISTPGRAAFCAATAGMALPSVDHWCGRGDLKTWVKDFQYNRYEYSLQRCPAYEMPDGNGMETPALDLLVAMRLAYKL